MPYKIVTGASAASAQNAADSATSGLASAMTALGATSYEVIGIAADALTEVVETEVEGTTKTVTKAKEYDVYLLVKY